ncbi:unnamed protein product [Brassica oleracea]
MSFSVTSFFKDYESHFESLLLFSVLFTTYDIALLDQDFLSQILWQYTVIDEAQILKNPNRLSRKRWE